MKRSARYASIAAAVSAATVAGGLAASASTGWTKTVSPTTPPFAAQAKTMQFSVTGGTLSAELYPASVATGALHLSISNPMPFAIAITSIQPNGTPTGSATGGSDSSCLNSYASYAGQAAPAGGNLGVVPAASSTGPGIAEVNSTSPTVTLSQTLTPDSCQGATFAIPVTVTAQQVSQ